jgi:hypothetical protein
MINLSDFCVDVTPPVGVSAGFVKKAERILDPLFARGLILEDEDSRIVIVSMDYCAIVHSAYEELRESLAKACDTSVEQVVIHCIHQHDAPLVDFEAVKYLGGKEEYSWWPEVLEKCSKSAKEALKSFKKVAAIGCASTQVDGFASNRRVAMPDGSIAVRYSRCGNEEIRSAPTGTIDPLLKTIAFKSAADEILCSMSFYATHPQVANTGDKFSADAPGEALRLLKKNKSLNMFFTGCGGNITAGKYSSLDPDENLIKFGKKLGDAISRNISNLDWHKADSFEWDCVSFEFPYSKCDRKELLDKIKHNPKDYSSAALLGMMDFGQEQPYKIFRFKADGINIFFLSGELFVEYQLYINSLYPNGFAAVAANCRDDFFYCPQAVDFENEGGYETSNFCCTTSEFEPRFKAAVKNMVEKE